LEITLIIVRITKQVTALFSETMLKIEDRAKVVGVDVNTFAERITRGKLSYYPHYTITFFLTLGYTVWVGCSVSFHVGRRIESC